MKILDLIDPERSDIRYKRFTFPDGQPHFELLDPHDIPVGERCEVLCRIRNASDIVDVGMAVDVLLASSLAYDVVPSEIALNVAYMLGARMDRRINPRQPFTLDVLACLLKSAADGLGCIRVLDPHSTRTLQLLGGYDTLVEPIYPDRLVQLALLHYEPDATIVIPDEGAIPRTSGIVSRLGLNNPIARCMKKRDSTTGALSGFALVEGDVTDRRCLIVDDLCDGGGTFAGIAGVLRDTGAASVALCVTHGIFSKGSEIAGIDGTYCTDSFGTLGTQWGLTCERDEFGFASLHRPNGRPSLHVLTDFVRDYVTSC